MRIFLFMFYLFILFIFIDLFHFFALQIEKTEINIFRKEPGKKLLFYLQFLRYFELIKSVSPKISRIGRQKRNNGFFLIWPKEPFWWTIFGNDIKRFDFLFLSSKFAKLENSATGPSVAAMRLEIWHMFNMLVWTYQTLSWDVLCTVFVASLKLYSGLNVVLKCFLLQDS